MIVAARPDAIVASVVIEWENVRHAATGRCGAMLAELMRQIDAHPGRPGPAARDFEILVVYDDREIAEPRVRQVVAQSVAAIPARAELRFVAGSGRSYYEQKNLGAAAARGRFVVFLDSDVVPEPGWLERLLGSFADPAVEVVGGGCFIDASDVLSKTLALAWFFPLRDDRDLLVRHGSFFANNVAFRREVAERYPFVPLANASRGACRLLARRLTEDGRGLFVQTAARVSHPAPAGLGRMLVRALAQGRDNLLFERTFGRGTVRASLVRGLRLHARAWKRILRHRREVGLGVLALPAALTIASVYYGCYALGDAATRLAPGWAGRQLRA